MNPRDDRRDSWWRWRLRPRHGKGGAVGYDDYPAPAPIVGGRTAQVVYQELVKDLISPGMRSMGFTGSGGSYLLKSDTHWIQVGLQKSTYSDRSEIRFAGNVSVARKDRWEAKRTAAPDRWGAKPAPGVGYGDVGDVVRLRASDSVDETWWIVHHDRPAADVAADFLATVEGYGLSLIDDLVRSQDD